MSSDDLLPFDEIMLLYVRFLRTIGLLPFEARDFDFLPTRIFTVYFLLSNAIGNSMYIGHAINHIMMQDKLQLDYYSEAIPVVGAALKYIIIMVGRNQLQEIFADSREIWNKCTSSELHVVLSFERKIRLYFKFFLGLAIASHIMYVYFALTNKLPPLEPDGPERRILFFRFYVDDVSTSPAYELVFMTQMLVDLNMILLIVCGDTVTPLLIMLSCGYLRVIQKRLILVFEQDDTPEFTSDVYGELIACFKLHQRILNKCTKIKNFSPWIFFVQILCTCYVLSLIGLKFASSDPDKYKFMSLFILFVCQLYICEWAPDTLIQESFAVSTAAYFASLSRVSDLRARKLLSIVIKRAQRPITLTAAGFIRLSIESFGSMISSAISFFMVLRSFNA